MQLKRLTLEALTIPQNGSLAKEVPATLSVALYYPRPGYPVLVTAKPLGSLADGHSTNYAAPNPATGQPYTWPERILFKEEIEGEAFLLVHVKVGKTGLEKFLDGLLKGLFGAAAGTIASPYLAAVGGSILQTVFQTKDDDDSRSIAAGGLLITEATPAGVLTIGLTAPSDVVERGPVRDGPQVVIKDQTLLTKDQPNGSIQVRVG